MYVFRRILSEHSRFAPIERVAFRLVVRRLSRMLRHACRLYGAPTQHMEGDYVAVYIPPSLSQILIATSMSCPTEHKAALTTRLSRSTFQSLS